MAKTKESEKAPKPIKEKDLKEKPVKIFEDISEVRSNIDQELFEGIKGGMDYEDLLGMMGKGGRHIDESFQVLLGKPSGGSSGAGTSGVQKEKKKRAPRKKKVATTDVSVDEDQEEGEVPEEGAT
ncbi:hypothetical protein Dimus_016106 [Dionaea muscipula]